MAFSTKEIASQQKRIEDTKADSEKDEHDVKKQGEVLKEYEDGQKDELERLLKAWEDLNAYIAETRSDPSKLPAGRCNRHIEFLWRKRYKIDLVSQFIRSEPWISKVDRLKMRELMVSTLGEHGYSCLLANTSSAKARVRFPSGEIHRITGIAFGPIVPSDPLIASFPFSGVKPEKN